MQTMKRFVTWIPAAALTVLALYPAPGAAAKPAGIRKEAVASADQKVEIKKVAKKKEKKKEPDKGWFPKLSLGFGTSLAHTYQVPGVENGISLTLGGVLTGEVRFKHYEHSWQTNLNIVHAWSKTPTLKPFIKSADETNLRSYYNYRFKRFNKAKIFAGVQLLTPLAPGDLVVGSDTDLLLTYRDGSLVTDVALSGRRYRLTRAFAPLVFKQMAGGSITPYEKQLATLEVRLSIAGQEVWADGWAVQDDKATPEIELKELVNFQQLGLQLEALLGGKIQKQLVYAFRMELMYPFVTSIDTDLSGFDLMNARIDFSLGLKLGKWASLEYVFGAKKEPLIVDQWQLINNLVLTISVNIL